MPKSDNCRRCQWAIAPHEPLCELCKAEIQDPETADEKLALRLAIAGYNEGES